MFSISLHSLKKSHFLRHHFLYTQTKQKPFRAAWIFLGVDKWVRIMFAMGSTQPENSLSIYGHRVILSADTSYDLVLPNQPSSCTKKMISLQHSIYQIWRWSTRIQRWSRRCFGRSWCSLLSRSEKKLKITVCVAKFRD